MLSSYLAILGGVMFGFMPMFALIGLLTVPIGIKAMNGALANYDDNAKLVPAQAANVMVILSTQFLIAIGYVLAVYIT